MMLGRKHHDPVQVARAPRHTFGATLPPAVLDRSHLSLMPGLYGNDIYPDCTAVALVNAARGVAVLNGFGLVVEPDKPLEFYAGCVGNPPSLAASDGAVMLDVLRHQGATAYDVGPQRLVGNFGTVRANRTSMALAMARLGFVYFGVTLLDRDMEAVNSGTPWDTVDGRDDGGIVGGHAVFAWDYAGMGDNDHVRVGTWGQWQPASWKWIEARTDEAYALVWRQLARADGTFYDGVTADGLVAEL